MSRQSNTPPGRGRYPSSSGIRTPAWQDCICGEKRADWGEVNRYYRCCTPSYIGDELVAIGPLWLAKGLKPKHRPTAAELLAILTSCPPVPDGMTTALYRRYDAQDNLLYLGVSDDLPARSSWHERHSPWAPFVARRTTEWFASRAAAEDAEREAIRTELPLFNKQHAAPGRQQEAARYLAAEGRVRLVQQDEGAVAEPQK